MHKNSSLWCSYPPQFSYTHAQLADQRGSLMQHIAPWSIPGSGVAATQLPQPSCYWKQVSRGTWFLLPDKLCVLKNTILTQFQLARHLLQRKALVEMRLQVSSGARTGLAPLARNHCTTRKALCTTRKAAPARQFAKNKRLNIVEN